MNDPIIEQGRNNPFAEQVPEQVGLDLKCPGCGNNLTMNDKGLVCPVCDKEKKVLVKKHWLFGYKVIEAHNVFCGEYLTIEQCEELTKKGVDISVKY